MLTAVCFIALASILIACNKESVNKQANSQTGQGTQHVMNATSGVNILIFKVNLNRYKGTNRHYVACGCNHCGGFCDFEWFPDFKHIGSLAPPTPPTIAVEKNDANNTATIYFIGAVDSDELAVNPTYYVDEDVKVHTDTLGNYYNISSGEYPFVSETGTVNWEDEVFSYDGKIVVETF